MTHDTEKKEGRKEGRMEGRKLWLRDTLIGSGNFAAIAADAVAFYSSIG
jgi:hypothetical protein